VTYLFHLFAAQPERDDGD